MLKFQFIKFYFVIRLRGRHSTTLVGEWRVLWLYPQPQLSAININNLYDFPAQKFKTVYKTYRTMVQTTRRLDYNIVININYSMG